MTYRLVEFFTGRRNKGAVRNARSRTPPASYGAKTSLAVLFRSAIRDQGGNFAAIGAIAMVPIMAGVAGAIDLSMAINKADRAQNALDTAALAIAHQYSLGTADEDLKAYGARLFETNRLSESLGIGDFRYQKTSSDGRDFFEVKASISHKGFLGWDFWKMERKAVAMLSAPAEACMLALDSAGSPGIRMSGSTSIRLEGCSLASNSNAANALERSGSASLEADCAFAVGGSSGLDQRTKLACGAPRHNRSPVPDPLATITPPSYAGCSKLPAQIVNPIAPGTYCNQKFRGTIQLQPGTYILRGGDISLGGGGSLTGRGVMIFLMEGAEMNIGANQVLVLSPPESGAYAGITVYQERSNTTELKLVGGAGTTISGFFYAPTAPIVYRGNDTMISAGACLRLVGKTIDLSGNSAFATNCQVELGDNRIETLASMPILVE